MPLPFPGLDADGNPVTVTYYTVAEAAFRLHISRPKLREMCRANPPWPHLPMGNRIYLSDADLAAIVARLRAEALGEQPTGIRGAVADEPDDDPGPRDGIARDGTFAVLLPDDFVLDIDDDDHDERFDDTGSA